MDYRIDIYRNNADNSARFALGISGKNPLVVMGINPSTADDTKPDQTIRKVMGYAERNGFDGFIMINVYPLRATNPNDLPLSLDFDLNLTNIYEIKKIAANRKEMTVLAAFGNLINKRPYLKPCFVAIVEALKKYGVKWKQIGELTGEGNPRHPLMGPYLELRNFDLEGFLNINKGRHVVKRIVRKLSRSFD